ncbi:MAG: hydroxymethylbilane synthase [Eudoraea sp.]|nr:hydroxymethylbilane synthase [Eudoraea sp.]MBT8222631.1 hydroxymethylbilane synthase [Eudoraea sp.]MBT8311331.1 hydroxymethylbilane synthase [Eudoraea sp.]NNJ37733.1 hydroxymethylbilane synthase [Flavobacteriaceae bacterium]NNJ40444.1 hydroxymethylbilane synthase [Eudoraea sp.]
MKTPLRIGTRDSELALWQASAVKEGLDNLGIAAELIPTKSIGDIVLDKPLYELGVTGIFTKALDVALLKGEIDLAVHSMKDMPTQLPEGLRICAVLERGNPHDVLIHKGLNFLNEEGIIATGSLRRQAQWLHRYPNHEITDLRGNVQTRLKKLEDNAWNGALFAAAGLERLSLNLPDKTLLKWMIPAPAQGAIAVLVSDNKPQIQSAVKQLNHHESDICTRVERDFLRTLEGGCSAPIGALARVTGNELLFQGILLTPDGQKRIYMSKKGKISESETLGKRYAQEVLEGGGDEIMREIKARLGE